MLRANGVEMGDEDDLRYQLINRNVIINDNRYVSKLNIRITLE